MHMTKFLAASDLLRAVMFDLAMRRFASGDVAIKNLGSAA
jgi:hypothetical protein